MLTNLVPHLWKEDHLGLTHGWCTHIFVQDLFIIISNPHDPTYRHTTTYTYTYIYSLINLSLLESRSITRGPPLPVDLGFMKKVLHIQETVFSNTIALATHIVH